MRSIQDRLNEVDYCSECQEYYLISEGCPNGCQEGYSDDWDEEDSDEEEDSDSDYI